MKKKTILSSAVLIALSLGLSAAVTVLAADNTATNQGTNTTTSTTANNNANQPGTNQDTAKNPVDDQTKPADGTNTINGKDLNKALGLNGKYAKLTKTSFVYNKNGKRVKGLKVKKGTVVGVSGLNVNKSTVYIGFNNRKNQYLNVKNVKAFKAVEYKLKRNALIYNSNGVRVSNYYLKKGKKVIVVKTKKVNGVKLVGISDIYYLKWADLDHHSAKILGK